MTKINNVWLALADEHFVCYRSSEDVSPNMKFYWISRSFFLVYNMDPLLERGTELSRLKFSKKLFSYFASLCCLWLVTGSHRLVGNNQIKVVITVVEYKSASLQWAECWSSIFWQKSERKQVFTVPRNVVRSIFIAPIMIKTFHRVFRLIYSGDFPPATYTLFQPVMCILNVIAALGKTSWV